MLVLGVPGRLNMNMMMISNARCTHVIGIILYNISTGDDLLFFSARECPDLF